MRLTIRIISLAWAMLFGLVACNFPSNTPNSVATLQAIYTAQAFQTQTANIFTALPLPTLGFPTLPPLSVTPLPTLPPGAKTSVPLSYCNWAAYVKDVTIPDGTIFAPGAQFTKTWRLQNIGTCSWTPSYALIFASGNPMGGAGTVGLSSTVVPGQSIDISVGLTAPASEGSYRGYWMLRNASGGVFGIGGSAMEAFYVDIKVVGGMTTVFDFAANYCDANWQSGAGDHLDCHGNGGSNKGYAVKVEQPQLENGTQYNGRGILTLPENVNNGYLQGYYQPFLVQNGDRFRSIINCEYLASGCNVVFRLDYKIGNGPVKTYWQFTEAYEGLYYPIDADLSPLAGNNVQFILSVFANGSASADRPLWAGPRIDRPSNLVTPSATPTKTATPTITATGLPPATNTVTPTVAVTATATATPTITVTSTPTLTATPTLTVTPTSIP